MTSIGTIKLDLSSCLFAVKLDANLPQLEDILIKFVKMLAAYSTSWNTDTTVSRSPSLTGAQTV